MTNDPDLFDLLARGVPWPLAREALASLRIDRADDDGQTMSVDP